VAGTVTEQAWGSIALQLRYLQTLLEIGTTNSTTIVFPAPIELMRPFLTGLGSGDKGASPKTAD
jgi:hypothetical protein